MDREHLSAVSVQELGEVFMATLQEAGPDLLEADLEGIERHLQRLMRPVMGRVVETVLAAIAATQATLQPVCSDCGDQLRLVDLRRQRRLQGLVGDYTLRRAYFVCDACVRPVLPKSARKHVEEAAEETPMS